MIIKTSFFLIGVIATVLLVSVMATEEASAFEPTKKELKVIKKYVKVTNQIEELCPEESENSPLCIKLKERQMKHLVRLNDLGLFTTDQQPDLRHLTEEYDGTRAAAQAGIEPIEDEPPMPTVPSTACDCDDDEEDPKTMYVKSAYKTLYKFFGFPIWAHFSGVPSADIDSGITSSGFTPLWRGYLSGLIPYCYTSSIILDATASYGLAMTMSDHIGSTLIAPFTTPENSYFVWYNPSDIKVYHTQNNVAPGPTIGCTISSVSVS